jgi:hypothetical protein
MPTLADGTDICDLSVGAGRPQVEEWGRPLRYLSRNESLLPWLLAQTHEAEHLLVSGPVTADGVEYLRDELETLLIRGGTLVVRGGSDLASLQALSDSNPGRVLLPPLSANEGLRVGVRRRDGQAVAYLGSGSISQAGLHGETEGIVLDGRRDAPVAQRLMQEMTSPDDAATPTKTNLATQGTAPTARIDDRPGTAPAARTRLLVEIDTLIGQEPEVRIFLNGKQVMT